MVNILASQPINPFLYLTSQLRCAGVLEAVRISRLGYPQRYSHNDFVKRYKMLKPSSNNAIDTKIHSKQIVHLLVSYISEHMNGRVVS